MDLEIYDCEVFKYDWLVVFKNHTTGQYAKIWSNNDTLINYIDNSHLFVGFNSKHYDYFILKAICMGFDNESVKKLNDFIMSGGNGWKYDPIKNTWFDFHNIDVMDDMQMGLSLKSIEGHLGLPIRESNVPFDIDRPLTSEERKEVEEYCMYDVDTTEIITELRKNYLQTKIRVGQINNIEPHTSMSMTNAKLTAKVLQATWQEHDDERDYKFVDNVLWEYVPKEVFEFFDKIHDKSIPDEDYFSSKLTIFIGDCEVTLGFGGAHGAIKNYIWEQSDDGRIIRNKDVMGYYPHTMVFYNYTSRNSPSPKIFEDMVHTRDVAKINHDKKTAVPYKLVTNTSFGACMNKYNDLWDPLQGRSVCITGQIFLIELAFHLYQDVPDLRIIQVNTDGIMLEFPKEYVEKVEEICNEWQTRTRFTLEEDAILNLYQKDVNNYIEVLTDGSIKKKGGYLVRGISEAGAFNINNNAVIVAKAIEDYFVKNTPVEQTINDCQNILDFQLIAKASTKYKSAFQLIDEKRVEIQRCNRVYATKDTRYGTLYKVKKEDDSIAKIGNLPDHCVIDNENVLSVSDIDKDYYINLAISRINDFKGEDMATTKTEKVDTSNMNVFTKLIKARNMFLNENIKKSGKNMKLTYQYFELKDIVPAVTKIFEQLNLISVVNFSDDRAVMSIYNGDKPEDYIDFNSPMREIEPIVSNTTGKEVTNAVQRLGAAQTYMRRYLYMIAMDIVEDDTIEAQTGAEETVQRASTPPPTKEEREKIATEITAPEDMANELQIKQLKESLKKLKQKKPETEEEIMKIAVETDTFTKVSKKRCEEILQWVAEGLGD